MTANHEPSQTPKPIAKTKGSEAKPQGHCGSRCMLWTMVKLYHKREVA